MELADVTDSKSVGSDTVRVRPPPSAPEKYPQWRYSLLGVIFVNCDARGRKGDPTAVEKVIRNEPCCVAFWFDVA